MSTPINRPLRPIWLQGALLLVMLGLMCSAYLLTRYFAVVVGSGSAPFDICQTLFGGDCDAALRSDLAVQFGIPLAGWGLVHFLMVAAALAIACGVGDAFRTEATLAALLLCAAATLGGGLLTAKMVDGTTAFCSLCVVVHGVNLLLLPTIVLASGLSVSELCRSLTTGCANLLSRETRNQAQLGWKITGLITVALVGVVGYQWVLLQADRRVAQATAPATFERVLSEYQAAAEVEIPFSDDDPWLGNPDSKLQLVVFSDFQCPACQGFAKHMTELRQQHPELAVVFKHFPLGHACNPKSNSHPLSCDVAYAAEAARQQGKFWTFHDGLFATPKELTGETLIEVAQNIQLDIEQWKADLSSPATKAKVAADVELGIQLKVPGTPTVLLNGRPLPNGGKRYLDQLVKHVARRGAHEVSTKEVQYAVTP